MAHYVVAEVIDGNRRDLTLIVIKDLSGLVLEGHEDILGFVFFDAVEC
jgi:hypothetical protein